MLLCERDEGIENGTLPNDQLENKRKGKKGRRKNKRKYVSQIIRENSVHLVIIRIFFFEI